MVRCRGLGGQGDEEPLGGKKPAPFLLGLGLGLDLVLGLVRRASKGLE